MCTTRREGSSDKVVALTRQLERQAGTFYREKTRVRSVKHRVWPLGRAGRAAQTFHTRDVSERVRQDVLLLAGARDHYVPLSQLWDQMPLLSNARSITARVFTAQE